ncbi:flavodoxin [Robertmurraya korlensis]|uniref:flavodoxin n=1 Tax=Robertmurraya korlensis TaxID=519977 RepID=UPI00203E355B|nr:flavodoxin [Robertmurraya korlensis]MCM3601819.1 flavodoxin [Robertmurraya korlensis]
MKIGVIYASMSGNTEAIADIIVEKLKEHNHEVDLKDMLSLPASDFLNYDLIFIGMYTWGDGDYPDECLDIIEEIEQLQLEEKPFALFGSGDTSYPEFCGALDKLKELIENQNGVCLGEPLRIEFNPSKADEEEINQFVMQALTVFEKSS